LQFSVLVALIALPDETVVRFMEKFKLIKKTRNDSTQLLINYTVRELSGEDFSNLDFMTGTRVSKNWPTVKRNTVAASEVTHTYAKSMNGDPSLAPSGIMNSFGARIDFNTSDDEFKANYSPEILSRRSTLNLKTSFHLINITLMGLCKVFKIIEEKLKNYGSQEDLRPISNRVSDKVFHEVLL